MNILESNKLIAEFMGLRPVKTFGRYSISKDYYMCCEDTAERALEGFGSIAKYNTSWDWLMPVVEKIENLHENINVLLFPQGCSINRHRDSINSDIHFTYSTDEDTKIKAVYKAVVEFIKWWNKQEEK